ncbi:uncharacterized protein LOC109861909 isoform X2 [Pseudomyrmex gracilis]|uniref:uncharacterized protein LOC109861909 isoform X2 n=1 Tax=Pseudomyrmex gracilis TaxID=219809 RepID=UPI000995C476|nr:uncharacterized protein LOC109861909 isoform X2 [Pseudomyrmex gracilis]
MKWILLLGLTVLAIGATCGAPFPNIETEKMQNNVKRSRRSSAPIVITNSLPNPFMDLVMDTLIKLDELYSALNSTWTPDQIVPLRIETFLEIKVNKDAVDQFFKNIKVLTNVGKRWPKHVEHVPFAEGEKESEKLLEIIVEKDSSDNTESVSIKDNDKDNVDTLLKEETSENARSSGLLNLFGFRS